MSATWSGIVVLARRLREFCYRHADRLQGPLLRQLWSAWVFYGYPGLYLWAALSKNDAALALYYGAIAVLLVGCTTSQRCLAAGRLQLLYRLLAGLSIGLLTLSALMHLIFIGGWQRVARGDFLGLLSPAVVPGRSDDIVGTAVVGAKEGWFFMEFTVAVASLTSWLVLTDSCLSTAPDAGTVRPSATDSAPTQRGTGSQTQGLLSFLHEEPWHQPPEPPGGARASSRSSGIGRESNGSNAMASAAAATHGSVASFSAVLRGGVALPRPPLARPQRLMQLAAWLLVSALAESTAFAGFYALAAAAGVLLVATWPRLGAVRPELRSKLVVALAGLLTVCGSLHIILACVCTFCQHSVSSHWPPWVLAALGRPDSLRRKLQCLMVMGLCVEVLRSGGPRTAMRHLAAAAPARPLVRLRLRRRGSHRSSQRSTRASLSSAADGEPSSSGDQCVGDAEQEASEEEAEELEGEAEEASTEGMVEETEANQGEELRDQRQDGLEAVDGTAGSARSSAATFQSSSRTMPRSSSTAYSREPCATTANPWLESVASRCIAWVLFSHELPDRPTTWNHLASLLSRISLCYWPLLWPALCSLPLLIVGLVSLVRPLQEQWSWALELACFYEAVLLLGLFYISIAYDLRDDSQSNWEELLGFGRSILPPGTPGSRDFGRCLLLCALAALLLLLALSAFCAGLARQVPRGRSSVHIQEPVVERKATLGGHRSRMLQRQFRSLALFASRITMVAVVLILALTSSATGESSFMQLGYLFWFVCLLYRSDESPVQDVGWDILRGDVHIWRGLVVCSGATAVSLLIVESLAPPFGVAGLAPGKEPSPLPLLVGVAPAGEGGERRLLERLWLHVGLAAVAAAQACVTQTPTLQQHSVFAVPSRWLLRFGVCAHFCLLLVAALLPPSSIFAFFMLVLFCMIVTTFQFTTNRSRVLPLLKASAVFAMVLLLIRAVVALSCIQHWLKKVYPYEQHMVIWHTFALKPSPGVDDKRQLIMALLVLLARTLGSTIKLAILRLDERLYAEPPPALVLGWLRRAERWLPCVLISISYITMQCSAVTFLSGVQLVILELVLIVGRGWEYAGAFLSVCQMGLMLAQYLCKLEFVHVSYESKEYWGLEWNHHATTRELLLLALAVVQRTVHYHCKEAEAATSRLPSRRHMLEAKSKHSFRAMERSRWQRPLDLLALFCWTIVASYGAQLGCCLLILLAASRNSLWSTVYVVNVGLFLASGHAQRALSLKVTRSWLTTMALMVMISSLFTCLLNLWMPPHTIPRPTSNYIGGSVVCSNFESSALRLANGTICSKTMLDKQECVTQKHRCGIDWAYWLLVDRSSTAEFLIFFVLCLLGRADRLLLGYYAQDDDIGKVEAAIRATTEESIIAGVAREAAGQEQQDPEADASPTTEGRSSAANLSGSEIELRPSQPSTGSALSTSSGSHVHATGDEELSNAPPAGVQVQAAGSPLQPSMRATLGAVAADRVTAALTEALAAVQLDAGTAMPASYGKEDPEEAASIDSNSTRWSLATITSASRFQPATREVRSGRLGWWCICVATVVEWLALLCAFFAQPEANLIAIGYLWLLLDHLSATVNATLSKDPLEAFLRPTRRIGAFNFAVIVATTAFQCPSMPCPYTMPLKDTAHLLPGLGRDIPRTSFMSTAQCEALSVSAHLQGSRNEESSTCVLSAIFRCIGLSKASGPLSPRAPLWHLVLFVVHLFHIIVVARWRPQFVCRLEAERERLMGRADWYIAKLLSRRQMQLSSWDSKRQVLLTKLSRLSAHLDNVRAIWDGHRAAFTYEEEMQQEWETRVENLCLESGQKRLLVEELLLEFETAVREGGATTEEAQSASIAAALDEHVLSFLKVRTLRLLRKVTSEEEAATKARSLQLCRKIGESGHSDATHQPATMPGARWSLKGLSTLKSLEEEAAATAAVADGFADIQEESQDRKSTSALKLERQSSRKGTAGGESGDDSKRAPALQRLLHRIFSSCIDDTIFFREGDQTLRQHRKNDSLPRLFVKALISQVLAILVFCTALQFAVYRSVAAAISVSAVVLSLMAFPHVPFFLWVLLQWYTVAIIFAKMIFQLSVFCVDGSLRVSQRNNGAGGTASRLYDPLAHCDHYGKRSSVPWTAILGLRKVGLAAADLVAHGDASLALGTDASTNDADLERPNFAAAASYWDLLFVDLLVALVLLLSMLVARYSGRFNSLSTIMRLFEDQDKMTSATRSDDVSEVQLEVLGARTQQECSYASGNALVVAARRADAEPDETPISAMQNNSPEDSEVRILAKHIYSRALDWASWNILGSSRTRRPGLDLYPYRFFCALCCLLILLLGWSGMMGHGKTFTESLNTNTFSGRQAIALLLFLVWMVFDRALYAWYLSDPYDGPAGGVNGAPADEEAGTCHISMQKMSSWHPIPSFHQGNSVAAPKGAKGKAEEVRRSDRMMVTTIQTAIVALQLLILHILIILHWTTSAIPGNVAINLFQPENLMMLLFYMFYITYLALSSLQLRYDVHVMRGELRFTHSTDSVTMNLFRIYVAMPFLHELRVLTDWTATRTSLDFYMWMKLEDAHHNLYRTRVDMEWRAMTDPAERRPLWEKVGVGGLLLAILVALLVGPVMFFSTLNSFLRVPSVIVNAELSASIEVLHWKAEQLEEWPGAVENEDGTYLNAWRDDFLHSTVIYRAKAHVTTLDRRQSMAYQSLFQGTEEQRSVQQVLFPIRSDKYWKISGPVRDAMTEILSNDTKGQRAFLVFETLFDQDNGRGNEAKSRHVIELKAPMMSQTAQVLNASSSETEVVVDNVFTPFLHIRGHGKIRQLLQSSGEKVNVGVRLKLRPGLVGNGGDQAQGYWTLESQDSDHYRCQTAKQREERVQRAQKRFNDIGEQLDAERIEAAEAHERYTGLEASVVFNDVDIAYPPRKTGPQRQDHCSLAYIVVSDYVAPTSVQQGASTSSYSGGISVMSLYLGVVLTIGNFIRLYFLDSSKRIIYEEVPDTELLGDLCNGIYIARVQGNLEVEYKLYHELIRIYRSPELLAHLARPKGIRQQQALEMPVESRFTSSTSLNTPVANEGLPLAAARARPRRQGPQGLQGHM